VRHVDQHADVVHCFDDLDAVVGNAAVFAFGRTAEVRDMESGQTSTWTLVGATEADTKQGRLSAESPMGRALRDARVGEEIEFETPGGAKTYRVEALLD
jgi:transcription elongation GreA/GreB family factor